METENRALKCKIEELESNLEDDDGLVQAAESENRALKCKIEELESNLEDDDGLVQAAESENEELRLEMDKMVRILDELKNENTKSLKTIEEVTEIEASTDMENNDLRSNIEELESIIGAQRREHNEYLKKIKELTRNEQEMKAKFENLIVASNDLPSKSLSEIAAELRSLQDRILDAKKELSDDTEGKDLSQSSSSPLSVELSEADKEFSLGMDPKMQDSTFEIQNLVHSISATIEDLREEIIKSKDRVEMAHSSCDTTMDQENVHKVSQLNDEVTILNERLQDEEINSTTLESTLNEQKELNNKQREVIEQLQSDLSFIQDELERSKSCKESQLNVLKRDLDLKTAQCDELKDELQNLKDENNTLNDLIQSSRSKASSVNDEKMSALQEYVAEVEAENQRLHDELGQRRNELHSIHHSQENQLQSMVDKLQDEIQDLQSENERLQVNNVKVHTMQTSLDAINEQLQGKDSEIQKMAEQVKVLQDQNKNMEVLLEETRENAAKEHQKTIASLEENTPESSKEEVGNELIHSKNVDISNQEISQKRLGEIDEELLEKIELYDALFHQINADKQDQVAKDDNEDTDEEPMLGSQLKNTIVYFENANSQLRNRVANSEKQIKLMKETLDAQNVQVKSKNTTNQVDLEVTNQACHTDNTKATKEIERQKKSLQQLSETLDKRTLDLEKCLTERKDLQKELTVWKSKYSKLEMEWKQALSLEARLKERILKLNDENEGLLKDLKVKNAAVTAMKTSIEKTTGLENELKVKENAMKELQERVRDLTEANRKFPKQLKEKCMKIASLESSLTARSKSEKISAEKVRKLEHASRELKESMTNLTEEKDSLFKQLQESQTSSTHKIKELEEKLTDQVDFEEKWDEKEKKLQETIQVLQERLLSLSTENETLTKQCSESVESSEYKIKELEHKLTSQVDVEEKWDAEKEKKLQETNQVLQERLLSLSTENETLTKQCSESVESSEYKIKELEHKLTGQVDVEEKWDAEKEKKLQETIQVLQERLLSLSTENETLTKQCSESVESSEYKIKELEHKLTSQVDVEEKWDAEKEKKLQETIQVLQERLLSLSTENETLTKQCSESVEFSEYKIKELQHKLTGQMDFEEKWDEKEKKLQETIQVLQERLLSLSTENEALTKQCNESVESSEYKIKELEHKLTGQVDFEEKWDEKELQETIQVLQERLLNLSVENETLTKQCNESVESSEYKIKELEHKLTDQVDVEEKWDEKEKELQETIRELKLSLTVEKEKISKEYKGSTVYSMHNATEQKQKSTVDQKELRDMENKFPETIRDLKERILCLIVEKEKIANEYKASTVSSKHKITELENKVSEQMHSQEKWDEQEKKLQQILQELKQRILSLTIEKEKIVNEYNERTTSSDTKIMELQQKLADQMDSEAKWSEDMKDLENKIEILTDRTLAVKELENNVDVLTDKSLIVTKENERLLQQLKECETQLKYRKDSNWQELNKKVVAMEDAVCKLKSEKRAFSRSISFMVKSLQAKEELSEATAAKTKAENDMHKILDEMEVVMKKFKKEQMKSDSDEASIMAYKAEYSKSRQYLRSLKKNLENHSKRVEDLRALVTMKMEEENDVNPSKLQSALRTLQCVIANTLLRSEDEKEKLVKDLQNSNEKENRLSKKSEELKKSVWKLEDEKESLEQELQTLDSMLQETKNTAEETQKNSISIEIELKSLLISLKENMSRLENDKLSKEEEVRKLMESKSELEKCVKLKELTEKQLRDAIVLLQKENVEAETKAKQEELQTYQTLKQLKRQAHDLEDRLKEKEALAEDLIQDVNRLEKELQSKGQCVMEYRRSDKDLKRKLRCKEEQISQLEDTKIEAEEKMKAALESLSDQEELEQFLRKNLETEMRQKNKISAQQEGLQNRIDALTTKITKLEDEKRTTAKENDVATENLMQQLDKERNKARENLTELEREKMKTRDLKEEMNDKLMDEKKRLNDKVLELTKPVARQKDDLDLQTQENRKLVSQLSEATSTIAKLTKEKSRLNCDNKNLQKEIKSTIKQSIEVEMKKHSNREDVFMSKIEDLKRHITRLQDRKKDDEDEKRDRIRELQYKYQTAKDSIEDLQRHIRYRVEKEEKLNKEIKMLKSNSYGEEVKMHKEDKDTTLYESSKQRKHDKNRMNALKNTAAHGKERTTHAIFDSLEDSERTIRGLISNWRDMAGQSTANSEGAVCA
ncbi:hypothetical protein QZH41_011910 [Actinostola sp. cb2023]|nr:hypothetical protein QZH41_011910 [Actinostola sp. cb2023]